MPKKQSKRKKYHYNVNRKKEWKKSKRLPAIGCSQIKKAWDNTKSVKQNLSDMGLAVDPNISIPIPTAKQLLKHQKLETMDLAEVRKLASKDHVVEELVKEASLPEKKAHTRFSRPEVSYCTYMIDKYGEDYKAMARDRKNYYQETPKQIKQKIKTFKSTEQYTKYVEEKNPESTGSQSMDT
ncbi:nucleolar protein 16-like [Saccoglossus kowalevskii]|uniref:Nucleolar protein 16 n=1 Tax=Saccoglossus kowalevskii TaxID=10224 RepID=A0ABM0GY97_SACKO|nr:PREDICTED: nucleolar protein 16-like [Saccoglossus kowalevskii]